MRLDEIKFRLFVLGKISLKHCRQKILRANRQRILKVCPQHIHQLGKGRW
jgi:hypothetical protein